MKKIMILLLVMLFGAAIQAKNINIIMSDGTIKQAEFLGQDGKSIFIKNSEGKAETVMLKSVSKIFDSDSGEEMKIGISAGAKEASTGGSTISEASKTRVKQHVEAAQKAVAAINEKSGDSAVFKDAVTAAEVKIKGDKYEVLEKGEIKKKMNLFVRSLPSYFIFDWDEFYIDFMTGGDEIRDAYGVSGHINFTLGTAFALYVRPFDFAAIGVYTNTELFFSPDDTRESYYDLPSSAYGAAYRWIIYSEESGAGLAEGNTDNMFYVEPRIGIRRLGNTFDEAMLEGTKATAEAVEYSLIFGMVAGEFFNMKLGYHSCVMKDVVTTRGNLDIDMSGLYFTAGVTFH